MFKNIVKYFVRRSIKKAIKEMENTSFEGAVDIMNKCLVKNFKDLSYIQNGYRVIVFKRVNIPVSMYRDVENFTDAFTVINDKEVRFFFKNGNETIWDGFGGVLEHDILIHVMKNILKTAK